MEADRSYPFHFAIYHVPLYPTKRPYAGGGSSAGRATWLPIFDKHRLTTAFEHHDHVFKRTKLLRNNQVDPDGTLYLGDGCWGQGARVLDDTAPRWYHEKVASIQHFWLVDVSKKRVEYRAINKAGNVFDVYPPDAPARKKQKKSFFLSLNLPLPSHPVPARRTNGSVRSGTSHR